MMSARGTEKLVLCGVTLAAVAAGCGGAKSPAVANLTTSSTSTATTSTSTTSGSARPSDQALATCLTQHGLQASVGSPDGSGASDSPVVTFAGVTITGGTNPRSQRFQDALSACRKYLPGGGPPPLTPAQAAERLRALTAFAACMRKHGVPSFPDPNGQGDFDQSTLQGLDLTSPQAEAASHTCASLLPKIGPQLRLPGMG